MERSLSVAQSSWRKMGSLADGIAVPRHAADFPLDNRPATAHPRRLWGAERGGTVRWVTTGWSPDSARL